MVTMQEAAAARSGSGLPDEEVEQRRHLTPGLEEKLPRERKVKVGWRSRLCAILG